MENTTDAHSLKPQPLENSLAKRLCTSSACAYLRAQRWDGMRSIPYEGGVWGLVLVG
jgi:hypothetical protein